MFKLFYFGILPVGLAEFYKILEDNNNIIFYIWFIIIIINVIIKIKKEPPLNQSRGGLWLPAYIEGTLGSNSIERRAVVTLGGYLHWSVDIYELGPPPFRGIYSLCDS